MRRTPAVPGSSIVETRHEEVYEGVHLCGDLAVGWIDDIDGNELGAGEVLAFPGNVPHSYQNPDVQHDAYGVSVVILAKAGVWHTAAE